ncbi:MAG: hypothetical protein AAB267_00270, partial [Candidatus Desantisbacteria bacterium]
MITKKRVFQLMGGITIVFSLLNLQVSVQASQRTPDEMMVTAQGYARLSWNCSSANYNRPEYAQYGQAAGGCSAHLTCDHSIGQHNNYGEAYSYGRNDDTVTFINSLAQGLGAGSHLCHYTNYGGPPDWATGIDCSAFVSKCWEIPRIGTGQFDRYSCAITADRLRQGDILVIPGSHVILVESVSGNNVIAYEARPGGVYNRVSRTTDRLTTYGPPRRLDNYAPMLKRVQIYKVAGWKLKYDVAFTESGMNVNVSKPIGPGEIRFILQFSESMDPDRPIEVGFGKASPYNQHTVAQQGGGWTKTEYIDDTWYGSFTVPSKQSGNYDGTNTLRVTAWDYSDYSGTHRLDTVFPMASRNTDGNWQDYEPNPDTHYKFKIDTTPLLIKFLRILQGKIERIGNTIIIKDAVIKYCKDYETGSITTGLLVEGDAMFEIVYNESGDTERALTSFFTSNPHDISFLSYATTTVENDTYWGYFYIPLQDKSYHGTHTL